MLTQILHDDLMPVDENSSLMLFFSAVFRTHHKVDWSEVKQPKIE